MPNKKKISKAELFIKTYLDKYGKSKIIERYNELIEPLRWTSGDGLFRSDKLFCKKYKLFRFKKNIDWNAKSHQWELTEEEREKIQEIHDKLLKNWPTDDSSTTTVIYLQVFGKLENTKNINNNIRDNIKAIIKKRPCANCCTKTNIQCDHKNSLKNDPDVMDTKTQTLDHFQPLCGHCNTTKRQAEISAKNKGKRYSAKHFGYQIDFTEGDEILNKDDPNWYIGTYWGDCLAFKSKLALKK